MVPGSLQRLVAGALPKKPVGWALEGRGEVRQQADRQADDVGDAALEALDQGRAEGLDRVAARASLLPLAEIDVANLFRRGRAS